VGFSTSPACAVIVANVGELESSVNEGAPPACADVAAMAASAAPTNDETWPERYIRQAFYSYGEAWRLGETKISEMRSGVPIDPSAESDAEPALRFERPASRLSGLVVGGDCEVEQQCLGRNPDAVRAIDGLGTELEHTILPGHQGREVLAGLPLAIR